MEAHVEPWASYLIGFGGLLISAITLITAYLRSTKQDAIENQSLADRLDNINNGVMSLNTKVDKLDSKLDDHSNRITKIEAEVENIYRRLDKVEKRCERHFGVSHQME